MHNFENKTNYWQILTVRALIWDGELVIWQGGNLMYTTLLD